MIHLNLWVIFKLSFFFSFDLKFRKSLRNGDLNPARDGMIAPLFCCCCCCIFHHANLWMISCLTGRKLYKQLETDEESGFRLARTDGSVTEYTIQCQRLVQDTLAGIRGRVGEAEQLYAELQCGIQHAREIRRLEAGVEAVTGWVLGPGADLLRQLILRGIGQDPDSVLILQQELEHLELKCRVSRSSRYRATENHLNAQEVVKNNKPHPTTIKTIPRHLYLMMFHFDFPSFLQKPLVSNQNENPG